MNPRLEKLCLPRYYHDAKMKFWQPNAKLQKIDPPIYWKSLNYNNLMKEKKKDSHETIQNNSCERACSIGCHYTTLIYKQRTGDEYCLFIDFEHNNLEHQNWKETIEENNSKTKKMNYKDKSSSLNQFSCKTFHNKQNELDQYNRYNSKIDQLFLLDRSSYPNRSKPMSRRPRDVFHVDFFPISSVQDSNNQTTYKTFFHRKYLLNRNLRHYTLNELVKQAIHAELDIEIIGHFMLKPNELSQREIEIFELTSTFGDLYEGHIIRINKEKLVLLLASTDYSDIEFTQSNYIKNINQDSLINSYVEIEQIIINYVRQYFQTHDDYSLDEIRRMQIEIEPLTNQLKRCVLIHLLTDDDISEDLSLEITFEQEPILFQMEYENKLYFLQGIHEKLIIEHLEYKLKELFEKCYSFITNNIYFELPLNIEYDIMKCLEKMLYAYANNKLSLASREDCMRIAIEYSFDDILDRIDCQSISNMINDIQIQLRLQIERLIKAESTAKILLIGPPMKKEIQSIDKCVTVLEHHQKIFITKSDTSIGRIQLKDRQRHYSNTIYHDEIDGGAKSFHRLPMTVDSLTILNRMKQRQRVKLEENNDSLLLFGNGIYHLNDKQQKSSSEFHCRERQTPITSHSIDTISYNVSANIEQNLLNESEQSKQQRKMKKNVRSHVEYGKYKQKRKHRKSYEIVSEQSIHNQNSTNILFNNLFLLRQNKISKRVRMTKNDNATIDNSISDQLLTTVEQYENKEKRKSNKSFQNDQDNQDHMADDCISYERSEEESYHTNRYLTSLYGSLSSLLTFIRGIYKSKSSKLASSLDLAHIFIKYLHIPKDIAYEIASTIINARQYLIRSVSNEELSTSTSTFENESHQDEISEMSNKKSQTFPLNSSNIMKRITTYLSKIDWRIFNYITQQFLQNIDAMITIHALEFSSAYLMDLIDESVYQAYFHLKWCYEKQKQSINEILIEQFLNECTNILLARLKLIKLPLLENIALIHTLKNYSNVDIVEKYNSLKPYSISHNHDPCIWFSTDILIKTIYSFTSDIWSKMNRNYLSDYTKFEYLLISYFHKVEIIHNLQDVIRKYEQQRTSRNASFENKHILHVIDLNQSPKFYSDEAFKRFQFDKTNAMNDDIDTLKDLILYDIQKRNVQPKERSFIPLCMNDLIIHEKCSVLNPSFWITTRYQRRLTAHETTEKQQKYRNSSKFDENVDPTKLNNLPPDMRILLENFIKQYGSVEEHVANQSIDQLEIPSDVDITEIIENAIEAVEKFDREHHIGYRKLQNKRILNDRLTEFFKYAGKQGVNLLDNVLKVAKLRFNDPNKYLPLAVNIMADRLKSSSKIHSRRQTVQFGQTLETLLIATDDEPKLVKTMLKKSSGHNLSDTPSNYSAGSTMILPNRSIPLDITELKETTSSSFTGLTLGQLAALISGSNRNILKLTNDQIQQILFEQNFNKQSYSDIEHYAQTNDIPDHLNLTEEQILHIAMADHISMREVKDIEKVYDDLHLNDNQIQLLLVNMDKVNSKDSTVSNEHQSSRINLHFDQLIDLCNHQNADIASIFDNITNYQDSSLFNNTTFKFTISQISQLINQNKLDIEKLIKLENNIKEQPMANQRFYFTLPQLAFLLSNKYLALSEQTFGLSISQLVAIYMLQQRSIENDQVPLFALDYEQIKKMAFMQNMSLEHFQSLSGCSIPFQLTRSQLTYIIAENKTSIEEIEIHENFNESSTFDRDQLSALIYQNRNSLNIEQINALVKASNIKFDELIISASSENRNEMKEFRFKPQQLLALWHMNNISDNRNKFEAELHSVDKFILTDEQICCLLHSLTSKRLIFNETISDGQHPEQLRLSSAMNPNLNHYRFERIIKLIQQLSLNLLNDMSNQEFETIPSFVFELFKTKRSHDSNIPTELLTPKLIHEFESGRLPERIFDAYQSFTPSLFDSQQDAIVIYPQSTLIRKEILNELADRLDTQLIQLKINYNIEPYKGKPSVRQIFNKLQTMTVMKDFQSLIGREIDEIDLLNILQGFSKTFIDENNYHQLNRNNERLDSVNRLIEHIETQRLTRNMSLEESTAFIQEDITKYEELTQIHLSEADLRIISMNRFSSFEKSLNRPLNEIEFRDLLQTKSPVNYIEEKLLQRTLTIDERMEQEDFIASKTFPLSSDEYTRTQLNEILKQRAELVDQYDIIHSMSSLITQIENRDKFQILHNRSSLDEDMLIVKNDPSNLKLSNVENIVETKFDNDDEIELNQEKEREIKRLPIYRVEYFETILQRRLSYGELCRFIEDRFQSLLVLLSHAIKTEQIFNLLSGHYDKFERFLKRKLTNNETYQIEKSLLEVHLKYSNTLQELEYIIQRRLNDEELRRLENDQFHRIEICLGEPLNEKQIRNLLQGKSDETLNQCADLVYYYQRKYKDNSKRTYFIVENLIEKLEKDYNENNKQIDMLTSEKLTPTLDSIETTDPDSKFYENTFELMRKLSDDVRTHTIVSDDTSSSQDESQSIKGFEPLTRIVDDTVDEEHIEEFKGLTNMIENVLHESTIFQPSIHFTNQITSSWLSNIDKDTTFTDLSTVKSSNKNLLNINEDSSREWTLFKGLGRLSLGLKEDEPLMINVRHSAQTYIVGIPEKYTNSKSKNLANKLYKGEHIYRSLPKSRISEKLGKFLSELIRLPINNKTTHFIVPSRAYDEHIDTIETIKSEILEFENDELQLHESPEMFEWYEECTQRNMEIHAQIPTDYQPSIVYCHTGRRQLITPFQRIQQRKTLDKSKSKIFDNISLLTNASFSRSRTNLQLTDSRPTDQTVTDLIINTVEKCQKSDLLEALDELFSKENLDKYQITESHWQDIFLILLNSYLRSHSLNRKEIFQRLTEKLNELKQNKNRYSLEINTDISIVSPSIVETQNSLNEFDFFERKQQKFHSGLYSLPIGNGRNSNDIEFTTSVKTNDQTSITSHDSFLPPIEDFSHLSTMSNINIFQRIERLDSNSNALTNIQYLSKPKKQRRYNISIMDSNIISKQEKNDIKSIQLPPILPKASLTNRK